ncbi:MAG: peptidylprolyl isomerase [Pseudomonadota bacterium]
MFKIRILISAGLLCMATHSNAQDAGEASREPLSTTGQKLDGIVAIVNEGVVLQSQLDAQLVAIRARAQREGLRLPPMGVMEDQILEQLIVEQIQLQRADRIGIQISDQMLNTALANVAAQNGIPFEQLPNTLASEGISYGAYRRDMRTQLVLDQLRQIDVVSRIQVAPREIESCIADLEGNVVGNSDYRLSHILISVSDSATSDEFSAAEQEAEGVYQRLSEGASFASLAIEHSDSQQTRLQGGDLGWRKGDELPTLFSDVVGDMTTGDFSRPIRAVSGYHIIKIEEMRGVNDRSEVEQVNVRHILVAPNEIIDDATARQKVTQAREDILAGAEFGETAKLVSDDPGSANDGGDTGWTGPGTFVPEFEQVANELEVGVVSEPFQTQFGWHILEVLGRRTYDNTDEVKQMSCVQRVRNSKLANESELWVRRIRDEAYVEKRI